MKNAASLSIGVIMAAVVAVPATVFAARAPIDVTVQFGQYQFPQDPSPAQHILTPNEVTIQKGGTVTFEFNGPQHGIAIYPVDPNTTREDIDAGLCQPDAATCDPQGTATSNLEYFVYDSSGNLIVDTGMNPPTTRVDDPVGRLLWGGGPTQMTGRTALDTPPQQVKYRFDKIGKYLVMCTTRNHFINDHMFGFVNVVRKNQQVDE